MPLSTATPTPGVFSSPFDSPVETPTPGATVTLPPPSTETPWAEPPTPTVPPVPTPLPTPVVTPIPTAQPPIIPLPTIEATEPYTIVFRDGNALRAIDSDGVNERILLDVHTESSLFLGNRSIGIRPWGRDGPSPDGSQLALVLSSHEGGGVIPKGERVEFSLHLFDLKIGELRLLAQEAQEPVWSPDGSRIVYRSMRTAGLWIVDVATGVTEEIFPVDRSELDYWVNFFTWSPDGQKIALVRTFGMLASGEIWIVDAEGKEEPILLLPLEKGKRSGAAGASHLNWSPTGDLILFTSTFGENIIPGSTTNLWTIDVNTGVQHQLTQNMGVFGGVPVWSPDGNWIVFSAVSRLEAEQPPTDLWLIARDGNDLKRLLHDPAGDVYPRWVTNRNKVVFQKEEIGLWEVDLEHGAFKQLYPQAVEYMILE